MLETRTPQRPQKQRFPGLGLSVNSDNVLDDTFSSGAGEERKREKRACFERRTVLSIY